MTLASSEIILDCGIDARARECTFCQGPATQLLLTTIANRFDLLRHLFQDDNLSALVPTWQDPGAPMSCAIRDSQIDQGSEANAKTPPKLPDEILHHGEM